VHGNRTESQRIVERGLYLHNPLDLTVIVAMIAVRVVQMTTDEIIDMVAVRNALMSTARFMDVAFVVLGTRMIRCARGLVPCAGFKDVVIDVVAMYVVQMTVVQVIDMTVVFDGDMAATGPMGMRVTLVLSARHVCSSRKVEFG
jgi:hypothetical protein